MMSLTSPALTALPGPPSPAEHPALTALLAVEETGPDRFLAGCTFDEGPHMLYGGQVAAQALAAAGRTVPPDRVPHSLHCAFLRGGTAAEPTEFAVERDRDGRSFSARRVVARQRGRVLFTLSASFHRPEAGRELDVEPAQLASAEWPTRFWARCTDDLADDPLLHACVLTYLSDLSSGLLALHDGSRFATGPSLDHSLWFHRPARLDEWVLVDVVPRVVAGGRGWYSGTVHAADGTLVASLAQEALFRSGPPPTGWTGSDR
jgi:acyl-CoA thioesterase-2